MYVFQSGDLLNKALKMTSGDIAVINEDLSNFVQVGEDVINGGYMGIYAKNLCNLICIDRYGDRPYTVRMPSLLNVGGKYGSGFRKITFEMPEQQNNESWELRHGKSVDQQVFNEVKATVKYFEGRETHEVDISITETMLRESFRGPQEMDAFIAGIFQIVRNRLDKDLEDTIIMTTNTLIGKTISDNTTTPSNRVIHLITEYNALYPNAQITDWKTAFRVDTFNKYFAEKMLLTKSHMKSYNKTFNGGGKMKHTDDGYLKIAMLDVAKIGTDIYLQSSVYHNELTALPTVESVPYWQGIGTGANAWSLDEVSKIDVTLPGGETVTQNKIVALMYDEEAMGVGFENERTTTAPYNGKGEYTNYFFKAEALHFVDTDENAVVFVLD